MNRGLKRILIITGILTILCVIVCMIYYRGIGELFKEVGTICPSSRNGHSGLLNGYAGGKEVSRVYVKFRILLF